MGDERLLPIIKVFKSCKMFFFWTDVNGFLNMFKVHAMYCIVYKDSLAQDDELISLNAAYPE